MHNQIYTTSLKAWEGQTYIIGEGRPYKALVHANGGAIQEVYHIIFFISIAFILQFVKSKYRCDNIRKKWRIFKIRWRVMLHNQVAINVSVAIQAKGTAKSNA